MTAELKQQIIDLISLLHESIGETIQIEDWLSSAGRNYNRHHTTFGKMVMQIDECHVRMSGAIATLGNSQQRIEFKTDAIQSIVYENNDIIVEIHLKNEMWRRIRMTKLPLEKAPN